MIILKLYVLRLILLFSKKNIKVYYLKLNRNYLKSCNRLDIILNLYLFSFQFLVLPNNGMEINNHNLPNTTFQILILIQTTGIESNH